MMDIEVLGGEVAGRQVVPHGVCDDLVRYRIYHAQVMNDLMVGIAVWSISV